MIDPVLLQPRPAIPLPPLHGLTAIREKKPITPVGCPFQPYCHPWIQLTMG